VTTDITKLLILIIALTAAAGAHAADVPDASAPAGATASEPDDAGGDEAPAVGVLDGTAEAPLADAADASVDPLEAAYNRFLRYREEGLKDEAATAALTVAELTQERFGIDSAETATPLVNLAVMQSQTGNLTAAEQNYRAAIAVMERHEGMLSSRLINPLSGLGHTYNRAGMYEQAIKSFDRALRLNHIDMGFTNFEQFGIQDGLTQSYVGLSDYDEANFYQESQLEIYQRKFGRDDPQIVPAMYKLAEWYSRSGNLEESALTYRGADRILRENESETSAGRADALMGLARLYERQGNRPAAASTLRKGVKILDASPEPDRLRRATVRVALGDLYTRESRFGAANEEYVAAWADLSSSEDYLDRRDYYFELPVRLGGGPFPKLARNTRGKTAADLRDGYVEIRYSVDVKGLANDVVVVESDPPDVMDLSLKTTYERSVYRPRFVDGASAPTENLLARHEFRYAVEVVTTPGDAGELPRPEPKRGRLDRPGDTDAE